MTFQGRLIKRTKTFGFVKTDAGHEFFVHFSQYLSGFTPELNQILEFELAPSHRDDKPPMAVRVRVVRKAAEVEADLLTKWASMLGGAR